MTRKIKFRAWNQRKDWKNKDGSECTPEMEYGGFVIYPDGRKEFPQGGWDLSGRDEEMILLQYTGLYDKNGKEIYEGDIVNVSSFEPSVYQVGFNRGGFCMFREVNDSYYNDIKYAETGEIIGDIYQNPELLDSLK